MKTEDELDRQIDKIFGLVEEVQAPQGSSLVSKQREQADLRALEARTSKQCFETAMSRFLQVEEEGAAKWKDPRWWRMIHNLAESEKSLREVFTGGDESPASVKQYERYRSALVFRRPTKADA